MQALNPPSIFVKNDNTFGKREGEKRERNQQSIQTTKRRRSEPKKNRSQKTRLRDTEKSNFNQI